VELLVQVAQVVLLVLVQAVVVVLERVEY